MFGDEEDDSEDQKRGRSGPVVGVVYRHIPMGRRLWERKRL